MSLCKITIKNVKAEHSNFKHFLKKCLKRYTFCLFLRINFAFLLSLVWSHVCIVFCNLLKLLACFSVKNATATNELSFPVMFSSVKNYTVSGSVRRSHILHLAYCCIRRLMNMFLLFYISESGTD